MLSSIEIDCVYDFMSYWEVKFVLVKIFDFVTEALMIEFTLPIHVYFLSVLLIVRGRTIA